MEFWSVHVLKTLIFGRSKHLQNSSEILANTFSDSLAILQKQFPIYFKRDHVTYVWIFILYVYVFINVCVYVHVYIYVYMYVMYI